MTGDLVGRGDELAVLDRLLAAGGGARGVVLTGEPGIGKTRLLAELGRRAERRRWTVLSGQASEWEPDAPYGAVADALATALFLSEKTVERHLSRIFAKLGVSSRAALAVRVTAGAAAVGAASAAGAAESRRPAVAAR